MHQKKASVCFLEYNNKFLILQRLPSQYQGSLWGLVGGKIEEGESPESAVVREIQEEIGLVISLEEAELLVECTVVIESDTWQTFAYRVQLKNLPVIANNPEEFQNYKWVTPDECYQMPDLHKGLYQILEQTKMI